MSPCEENPSYYKLQLSGSRCPINSTLHVKETPKPFSLHSLVCMLGMSPMALFLMRTVGGNVLKVWHSLYSYHIS